tara:strand:- start:1491 stop:2108 length:618 start_codon:yes stop_codon:yes gene_type:complete
MASQVQIAKLALQHVGDRFDISSLTEFTPEAEQVNLIFNDTRDALLRQHPWNFAKKFVSPATVAGTVPGGWTFMYLYPTDAVRILGITNPLGRGQPPIEFEVARNAANNRVLLCDQESAEIVYTARITTTEDFDAEFTMALSYSLAAKLAMPLTGDRGIAGELEKLATIYCNSAWETDASEGIEPAKPEADWITARLGVQTVDSV